MRSRQKKNRTAHTQHAYSVWPHTMLISVVTDKRHHRKLAGFGNNLKLYKNCHVLRILIVSIIKTIEERYARLIK